MVCQDCSDKMATILFTQIVNGNKSVLHLCRDCAQTRGLQSSDKSPLDPINDFLAGMAEEGEDEKEKGEGLLCRNCGLNYKEFKASGRLGCSDCYRAFQEPLKKLIRKIHGSTSHHGKSPAQKEPPPPEPENKIGQLRKQLKEAVAREDYEQAARLRDSIREKEGETR